MKKSRKISTFLQREINLLKKGGHKRNESLSLLYRTLI